MLSVIKMRFSAHDVALREYIIAPPAGIRVLTPVESGTDFLAGIVRQQDANATMHGTTEPPAGDPGDPGDPGGPREA